MGMNHGANVGSSAKPCVRPVSTSSPPPCVSLGEGGNIWILGAGKGAFPGLCGFTKFEPGCLRGMQV